LLISCSSNNEPLPIVEEGPRTYKILPVGDSRVKGSNSIDSYLSYRYELWKRLIDSEIDFDFIGPKTDLTQYAVYNNTIFDADHAGYGGYTSEGILNTLPTILDPNNIPDIVLLGVGGNDLLTGTSPNEALNNISIIIDFIQLINPEVIIIVEEIAPAKSTHMDAMRWQLLNEFNNGITRLTQQQSTSSSIVVSVDMEDGWQDSYFFDYIHYNLQGAKEAADRYFDTLMPLIIGQ